LRRTKVKVIQIRLLIVIAVSVFILAGYGCSEEALIEPPTPPDPVWEKIEGIGTGSVRSMAFDDQDNLYVLMDSNRKVLFRSPDYGATWAITDTVSIDTTYYGNIRSFCFSGSNLLAGTMEGKIFLSDDGGNTFSFVDSIGRPQFMDVRHMASTPGGNVYAAVYGEKIYRSVDNGATWIDTLSFDRPNKDYTCIQTDSDECIYLGCWAGDSYRSCDYAGTWQPLEKIEDYELATMTSMLVGADGLLVTTFTEGFAIYRGDSAWVLKNAGLAGGNSNMRCLALTSDNMLYAGTIYDGVYRTQWGVWDWSPVNDGIDLTELRITTIAIDQNDRIYFGTVDNGIWRSKW
jgi:photosystem II stability/assembly factor-like uncharacterized protein